jgi:hypothetical protein
MEKTESMWWEQRGERKRLEEADETREVGRKSGSRWKREAGRKDENRQVGRRR